jgi:hypothetical protein
MLKSGQVVIALCLAFLPASTFGQIQQTGFQKPACAEDCCVEPCSLVCCAEVKTVKEKKHCWEVECEPVCIPKVRCPLFSFFTGHKADSCTGCGTEGCVDDCCDAQCGKVRMVRKLKKKEYECEKQVVEWTVRSANPGCGKCGEGCAPASCCAPCGI